MSQPVFKNWFTPRGRRNRKSFILAEATIWAGYIILAYIALSSIEMVATLAYYAFPWLPLSAPQFDIFHVFAWLWLIGYLFLAVANTFITAQRIRDFGYSGWWALVIRFVLPAGIVFLFGIPGFVEDFFDIFFLDPIALALTILLGVIPGTKGENKFGPDPLAVKPAKKRKEGK